VTEVSVIMPAYDAARFIGAAIDSILAEAPAALEVVVVDDGSRDDTHAIVERLSAADPRIRLIGQEHAGVSAARNKAVSSARGTFVAFLDADDLWPAGRLARHLRLLQQQPPRSVVAGTIRLFGAQDRGASAEPLRSVNLGALTMRRDLFAAHGMFDPTLRFFEDLDFLLRLHDAGVAIALEDEVALLHRRHEANMSGNLAVLQPDMVKALRHSMMRRRAGRGSDRPFPFVMPAASAAKARIAVARVAQDAFRGAGHEPA